MLMILYGVRQDTPIENLEHRAPIVRIVVLQMRNAQDRWTYVGMIGKQLAESPLVLHAGPDDSQPGVGDVVLKVAVIPRKAGSPLLREAACRIRRWRAHG